MSIKETVDPKQDSDIVSLTESITIENHPVAPTKTRF